MASSDASRSDGRKVIERRLLLSFMQAAGRAPYPYEIRQAEFGTAGERVAWIVQIDDPIPPLAGTTLPFDTFDVILRWPVRMVIEAVTPHMFELGFVDSFLLSIRDEGGSVYELAPALLRQCIDGSVTEEGVLNGMTITRVTG